jgi:hypothetical protein
MPVHNWRRVHAGTYHHFHTNWITELGKRLNSGLLPDQYYALVEQTAGETGPDVLALERQGTAGDPSGHAGGAAVAVTVAPPQVSYHASLNEEDVYTRGAELWRFVILAGTAWSLTWKSYHRATSRVGQL